MTDEQAAAEARLAAAFAEFQSAFEAAAGLGVDVMGVIFGAGGAPFPFPGFAPDAPAHVPTAAASSDASD